jgi:hypothetical protein
MGPSGFMAPEPLGLWSHAKPAALFPNIDTDQHMGDVLAFPVMAVVPDLPLATGAA